MELDRSPSSSGSISSQKSLSGPELIQHVSRMVKDKQRAELIILDLMEEYSFSFPDLKELLRDSNLEVSFSKVKYKDIAPMIGLDPALQGRDIPTFPIYQARITNKLFRKVLEDIQDFQHQYRPMREHDTEEARSRFLSAYFNKIVGLFSGLLYNTPESLLEGKITTKGRMEYQFKTYGGVTVLFIEVKLDIGSFSERLNCLAQVIAECDTCDWMNFQDGFRTHITAVLCDGKDFQFFRFMGGRQTRAGNPVFFLGKFPTGSTRQIIPVPDPPVDKTFFHSTRALCETLFYIFLNGYQSGLESYWNRSLERGKKRGGRKSTPALRNATLMAKSAVDEAKLARIQWEEKKIAESERSAEKALEYLAKSIGEAPDVQPNYFALYSEEMEK